MKNKVKCVMWDWNGTLLDDVDVNNRVLNCMIEDRNIDFFCDRRFYKDNFGFPVIEFYKKCGFDFTQESFEKVADDYVMWYARLFNNAKLFDNTVGTLEYIIQQGIRQIVLSASELSGLNNQINSFNLSGYFDEILGVGDSLGSGKIGIGCNFIEKEKINPDELVMIGDTDHDYAVAKALGCRCILISSGHQSRQRLEKVGCTVIDDIDEIKNIIRG